ncbi:carbonic anhydrase [Abortiporus biennis]|nr:carbonic anhydrase [Abortiporus biennis]
MSPHLLDFFERNVEWAEGNSLQWHQEQADRPQRPKILWIGCSDSRVPESVVTESLPGIIFVNRNIANQVHLDDENTLSVIQYAVEQLYVKHVVIAGHTYCGGAEACLDEALHPGHLEPPIKDWLMPLVKLAEQVLAEKPVDPLNTLIRENVEKQAEHVQGFLRSKKITGVKVHGWLFHIETGLLEDLTAC